MLRHLLDRSPRITGWLIAASLLSACGATGNAKLGVRDGALQPCPSSPNCVCSDGADPSHRIEPLKIDIGSAEDAWREVRQAVAAMPRTRIVEEREDYLRAECRSAAFRFIDDLELNLRPETGTIAVRSASRLGYSDMGVNRRRVERLRAALQVRGTTIR